MTAFRRNLRTNRAPRRRTQPSPIPFDRLPDDAWHAEMTKAFARFLQQREQALRSPEGGVSR
jgi:hypothetical protein